MDRDYRAKQAGAPAAGTVRNDTVAPGRSTLTAQLYDQTGAEPVFEARPARGLSASLMTTLGSEHAALRARHDQAIAGAKAAGVAADLAVALRSAGAVFGISLGANDRELSGLLSTQAWAEAELRLHLDLLPPALTADARVKAQHPDPADVLAAAARLAAGYASLFQRCAEAARWLDDLQFIDAFSVGFAPILEVAFGGKAGLTRAAMTALFSSRQRELLWSFLRTQRLPDGLFTGGDAGKVEPHQRILMASHMMVVGKVEKRDQDGEHTGNSHKGRANNCGHWVQLAWAYAGVNPESDLALNDNLKKATTGPNGEVSFGAGSSEQLFIGKFDDSLELEDRHAAAVAANPKLEGTPDGRRRTYLGRELYTMLKPGDWIWIYNANAGGDHSQVFAGWVDLADQTAADPKHGSTTYRTAKIFHQYDNKLGLSGYGSARLGLSFSFEHKIYPVTMVKRVGDDAGPAHSAAKLLQFDRKAAEAKNQELLTSHHLDRDLVSAQLSARARQLLDGLKALEPAQHAICEDILRDHDSTSLADLTMQIALAQRLARDGNVDGTLTIYRNGPSANTKALLGGRPLTDFRSK